VRSAHRKKRDHLEDVSADGKTLKGIFKNYDDERGCGTD